mgnify:CR=1 FL=1
MLILVMIWCTENTIGLLILALYFLPNNNPMNKNISLDFSLFDGFPDMCFLVNESGNIRVLKLTNIFIT